MSYYPTYQEQFKALSDEQRDTLQLIPHLEEIEGWLMLLEAVALYDFANSITSNRPIVCEIGTWKGRSAYVLGSAILNKSGLLYCIDPFTGVGDPLSQKSYQELIAQLKTPLRQLFEETMKKFELTDCIKIIQKISEDARRIFPENKIDVLFIDGNHSYESVRSDYELWSPLIPKGGMIILHDVGAIHVDGPKRVFNEFLLNSSLWADVRTIGEIGVGRKI